MIEAELKACIMVYNTEMFYSLDRVETIVKQNTHGCGTASIDTLLSIFDISNTEQHVIGLNSPVNEKSTWRNFKCKLTEGSLNTALSKRNTIILENV